MIVFSFIRENFWAQRLHLIPALLVGVLLLLGAGDDSARIDRIGHQLMCVCGCNQVLLECNHVGCTYSDRMRSELIAAIDRGDSDELALQAFVQKYGMTVLAAPTKAGFNRVAWIMPYLALILGIGAVVLVARTWRQRPPSGPSGGAPGTGDDALEPYREQARQETEL